MHETQPQMRISVNRPFGPATKGLIIATVAVFLVQAILDRLFTDAFGRGIVTAVFGLSRHGLSHFAIWQPVTYLFLHGGLLHIFFNMIGLYFFGGDLEQVLGRRNFLRLYFVSGILGGIGWLLFALGYPARTPCIGASGAVFGIAAAFAALFPQRRVMLLPFPVTVTARVMVIGFAVVALYSMIAQDGRVAHAAHLAGGVVGYVWGLRVARRTASRRKRGPLRWEDPVEKHRRTFSYVPEPEEEYEEDDPEPSEEEVDAILEKIQERGIKSLTRHERRILERAASGRGDASS